MKRTAGPMLLIGAFIAFLLVWLSVGKVHSMQEKSKIAKLMETTKTVCVGRFLIDVPARAEVSLSRAFIQGLDVSSQSETKEAFNARIGARETEINAVKNKLGRKNMELVKEVSGNGYFGKIFVFGRWRTHWFEGEVRKDAENVEINGYIFADGISFDFITDGYDPDRIGELAQLISQFKPNPTNVIPTERGFCIGNGIFLDPLSAPQVEHVVMFASLPDHPDIAIAFSTMTRTNRGPGLLARNAAAASTEPLHVRLAFTTLREGKRTINGLPGEELALRVRELNFVTTFGFDWEMGGKQDDVYAPFLTLELESGIRPRAGAKPVQSSLSEEAMTEFWDRLSSSIRIRPFGPPKPKEKPPEPSVLGAYVTAGEICPATGWWQCSEGGNGTGVLGGQRQYIKKGQRMPQALLLPPQTLWEKVRGVQRSYESSTPTAWKLADKRLRLRREHDQRLAQPAFPNPADLGSSVATVVAPAVPTPVGSYVKTGASCPASGWWRCEDSNALDGTRWFAQGSLLPVATFIVAPTGFGKSAGGDQVIQRRSGWQLVRFAEAPALQNPVSE